MSTTLTAPFDVLCEDTSEITRGEWLKLRLNYLGSSDVAGALGLSLYSHPYSIYCDKRELLPVVEQSEFYEWRLDMESPVLDWVEKRGWVQGPIRRHLMIASAEYPFLASNPDGLTDHEVVEAKWINGMDEKRWDVEIPQMYVVQAHVHMIVSGRRRCLLPVSFGGKEPREFWIDYNDEDAEAIIAQSANLWQQIQDGVEPDASGCDADLAALKARYYEPTELPEVELPAAAGEWLSIRNASLEIAKQANATINDLKGRIQQLMGNAMVATHNGEVLATWKPRKDGVRVFNFVESKENQ